MKAHFFATATACLCALLLAACDGIGTSIHADNPYGGLGGWTGDGSSGGADGSGGSSLGFDAGSLLGFSNTGNVEAIVRLFTTAISSPDAGGTIDVVFSAADLGLPAGGTVTLSLRGNGIDYENTKGADADGTVRFTVPLIASGTEITVSLTLWEADGTLACTGTKTQRVTGLSSDIAVSLSGGGSAPAPTPTPTPVPVPADLVSIPAGTFMMGYTAGYSSEKPVHSVTLTRAFYICEHEVTQAEYETYCSYDGGDRPFASYGLGPDYPVYNMSWYGALVYCNRRSMAEGLTPCYTISGSTDPADWPGVQSTGGKYRGPNSSSDLAVWANAACDWNADGYRLPTSAEWEYAARAGDTTTDAKTWSGTSSSSSLGDYAWYGVSDGSGTAHPVKTKLPNAWGLYDMSGNAHEWCWDWYDLYGSSAVTDPTGPSSGSYRVYRGGSYFDSAGGCTVSSREDGSPYRGYGNVGFRVVRTIP